MPPELHWVAHRGDMTRYPENTLLALENALQQGADAIEFDLQMNHERDFVVIHDDSFARTAGLKQSVLLTSTAALQRISVHQPARFGERFYPQPVPLLEQVLALLLRYPDSHAFIEIKTESLTRWGISGTLHALLEKLQTSASRCTLISFNLEAVRYAKAARTQGLKVGWVLKKYRQSYRQQAEQLQPDMLICNQRKIPRSGNLWQGQWQWMVYDVKDYAKALQYAQRGIEYIETGDIENMLKEASRHGRNRQ